MNNMNIPMLVYRMYIFNIYRYLRISESSFGFKPKYANKICLSNISQFVNRFLSNCIIVVYIA